MRSDPIILGREVDLQLDLPLAVKVRHAGCVETRVVVIRVAMEMLEVATAANVTHGQNHAPVKAPASWIGIRDTLASPVQSNP